MFPFGDSKSNGFHQILREVYSHRSTGCGINTAPMYITIKNTIVAVVHSLSPVQLFATRGTAAHQVSPSFTISPSLLKLMSIESVMTFNHPILCQLSSPAFNLSQYQGFFQWVSSSHQMAKVSEHHFRISSSSEYSEVIYFRIDWFDLLAVKGTLKRCLQNTQNQR